MRTASNALHFALLLLSVAAVAGRADAQPGRLEPDDGGQVDLASQDPRVALERLKVADGYEVNLFASEREFPVLANPLAMTFDAQGRLWVLTSPTYPHVLPGEKPDDKLIVLEDTNRDGRADKATVFADGLYIPTGFELGDGGVYISQQPNLMFLRDTNGDGKADERRIILHGFGTEDSHHSIHTYTWGPGGDLYFQEGTFLHSQVETPYGPRRLAYAGVWRYEPRTEKLDVFVSYPFANPWGHVVDRWGQNFISDASNGNNHYGTAFSGNIAVSAEASRDEGVDADARPSDQRHRVRAQPAVSRFGAGEFPLQQHDRLPGHQAVQDRGGRLGLHRHRDRAAAAVDRPELPAGGTAVRPGRRALRDRLVQSAGRPHAVFAARSAARQVARTRVSHHRERAHAARVAEDRAGGRRRRRARPRRRAPQRRAMRRRSRRSSIC